MNNGYKGMLRDRLLPSWNLALLWCKVKQRWIDIVYERNIKNIPKELRSENCKFLTGHKNKYGVAGTFMGSVDPDGFLYSNDKEEYQMWKAVDAWIKWFSKNQLFIYDIITEAHDEDHAYMLLKDVWDPVGTNEKLLRFMYKNKQIYYG